MTGRNGEEYVIIIDSGTLADILDKTDADLLDKLVKVIKFSNKEEFDHYLGEHYGKLR